MALDYPARVAAMAVLDVVPTGEVWRRADAQFAMLYWHWAFLAQPAPLPERMIAGDPQVFFDSHVRALGLGRAEGRYPADSWRTIGGCSMTPASSRPSARTTAPVPP